MDTNATLSGVSDADRLAADGIPISLKGAPHRLRFGMRALRYLEQEFGSLRVFIERLDQKEWGEDRIRAISAGMTAGLLHEKPMGVAPELFVEHLEELLDDGSDLVSWMTAMTAALDQSFPPSKPGDEPPKAAGSRRSSHGRAGTSSSRSATAGRKRRSGR